MMGGGQLPHRVYRILRISSRGHAAAEAAFYKNNQALLCRSFAEQRRVWLAEKVGHGDGLSRAMKLIGHEAEEIIYDLGILQRTWAWERDLEFDDDDWRTQILLAQIAEWKPEVVFLQDYNVLPYRARVELKARVPSIEVIAIHQQPVAASSQLMRELATADVLFVSSPHLLQACREAGLRPNKLHSCFDPGVLSQLPAPSTVAELPSFDFSFIGAADAKSGHGRRHRLLTELMRRTSLELWLPPNRNGEQAFEYFDAQKSARCHPAVFGLEFYNLLQRSNITLNCHRDVASGGADNRRLFEATGVGTCLLTDRGEDLADLFDDGTEIVTYDGVEDCVEKVDYLLRHENVRNEIAMSGRKRTLSEHSSRQRYAEVDEVLQKALAELRRSLRTKWRGLPRISTL